MGKLLENVKAGDILDINIAYTHPDYNKMKPVWAKCRDAVEGEEAIKAKGVDYLSKLNGQSSTEYASYLDRSQWFGATGRTVESYLGMLFRKSPVMDYKSKGEKVNDELKSTLDAFYKVVTYDGKSHLDFLRNTCEELIITNKVGVLVDFPLVDEENYLSQYQYDEQNLKPLISTYKAESIINWHWDIIDNQVVPIMFVLQEDIYTDVGAGMFNSTPDKIYRILYLENHKSPERRYKQIMIRSENAYNLENDQSQYKVQSVIYPQMDGKYLNYIPFFVLTEKGLDYRANTSSMINDLVNVNIGHYRNSADWENELHWVGCKTLYLPGWNTKKYGKPRIGGAMAGPRDSEPKLIEATSDSGLKDEMKLKEERMSILGAERISQKGRYIPSAETAKINSTSESSTLSNLSRTVSEMGSKIFTFILSWAQPSQELINVSVMVNTDFYQDDINGDELLKWIQAYQTGGISFDAYYYNMERKEAFPSDWSKEKEVEAIQNNVASALDGTDEKMIDLQMQIDDLKDTKIKKKEEEIHASKEGKGQ